MNSDIILNILLIVIILFAMLFAGYWYYKKLKKMEEEDVYTDDRYEWDYLIDGVSKVFSEKSRQNLREENMSRTQLEQEERKKKQLRRSLKEAAYGDTLSKKYVTSYITELLKVQKGLKLDDATVNRVMPFNHPKDLSSRDKIEIINYLYGLKHGEKGFREFLKDFDLIKAKYDEDNSMYYEITEEEIDSAYDEMNSKGKLHLSYNDKINIIARRIFADYKGFGPADFLFDTTIDEIDCGTSGIPKDLYDISNKDLKNLEYSYESIWIMVQGINIKMSCLSFGSQKELERVCRNVYKYNPTKPLSRKNPIAISTMKDGSRVLVAQPPASDSWVAFIRKFDSVDSIEPQMLFTDENNFLPLLLIKWLIYGNKTIAFTGIQGSGKSTTLKSFIRFIPRTYNIRLQEKAFELNLRHTYPKRNIVTFQETESLSAQEGLNAQKKTNGLINIIGEVADAVAATWIIQTSKVASMFTWFTHHAKTSYDLVTALRNNLLESGGYSSEKVAEETVAEVINIDFHMEKRGKMRYCERITEIIPIVDRRYPSEKSEMDLDEAFKRDAIEFFHRSTDRRLFETVNLIEWHPNIGKPGGKYYLINMPTEKTLDAIRANIEGSESLRKEFDRDMKVLRNVLEKGESSISAASAKSLRDVLTEEERIVFDTCVTKINNSGRYKVSLT